FVNESSVEINLNSADGLGPDMGVPTARALSQMTVGDFNGDGNQDVVTSHSNNDRRIAVYLGNGTGGLATPVITSLNQPFENVIAGRFNADGNDDVFVVDSNGRGYSMLSNGNGTFTTAPNFPVQLQGSVVKLLKGDFNEDGHLDLIVSNGNVQLWLGNGAGQFTQSTQTIPNLGDIVAGDFNDDGNLDLAGFDAGGLKALLGLGNGQFGQTFVATISTPGTPRSLVAADFNGDGSDDVAYLGQLSDTRNLFVVPTNGAASAWGVPIHYSIGGLSGYTAALFPADFNADGKIDLGYNAETARGIIYNQSGAGPCISINDVTITEGNTATTNASFTVTLSQTSTQSTSVSYSLTAGTATIGADLENVSGRLEIPAGQTTATINVPVIGDVTDEFDEQFTVTLSSPANGAISDGTAVGTIVDDDAEPTLTINDVTANEGSFGTFFNFSVALSTASAKPISFRYTTADGTAIAGSDYNAANNTILNIQPGATSASVGILVTGDNVFEPNENFFVNLTEPLNVSLSDTQAIGTINNDDAVPVLSIFGTFGPEGDSGVTNLNVNLHLSNPTSLPVTVNVLTSDGTAIGNRDFVPSDTQVTIPAMVQDFTAQVQVMGDVVNEPNENFFVNIYNVTNATTQQTQSSVTIVDDDAGVFDFEGDGKTDIGIFRPSTGDWWYRRSLDSIVRVVRFGVSTDKMVPADYSGDGKTDIAVWRPSTGEWFILRSENSTYYTVPFGVDGDAPAPGDYDNDGRADTAVFRASTSTWYIAQSTAGTRIQQFGSIGDRPVAADYDGDGRTDIAIFRPSSGQWWINRSTSGVVVATFGNSSDKQVQNDYSGDGKTDIAIWRPSTGEWFILRSEDSSYYTVPFGTDGDVPSPGDYDGDGRSDTTVFRPSTGTWYSQRTSAGILITQFGTAGDRPIANALIP
ncbi:MAG TPA: FG-GAP-like repeat-containing protein, partial [Pyrinomonadaceae bacterium]|nr:FG-GAP-like repeat-containing protein [Pyrinomonadaceae bacterium]